MKKRKTSIFNRLQRRSNKKIKLGEKQKIKSKKIKKEIIMDTKRKKIILKYMNEKIQNKNERYKKLQIKFIKR